MLPATLRVLRSARGTAPMAATTPCSPKVPGTDSPAGKTNILNQGYQFTCLFDGWYESTASVIGKIALKGIIGQGSVDAYHVRFVWAITRRSLHDAIEHIISRAFRNLVKSLQ